MAKRFTIFGNPVKHSISPKMHTFAIEGLKLDATYTKTHLEDGSKLKEIFLENFDGANVTVPHKETAFALCDEVRGVAKDIEAVNTLINEDGKMIGYNTDAKGFVLSAEAFGTIQSVLILGAGGTAKALATIYKQNGSQVSVLNRSKNRLAFFDKLGIQTYTWETFNPSNYDLVINTTSAGLEDDSYPIDKEVLTAIFTQAKYAIDVIYNKETPFLQLAKKNNLPNKDGADMLLYQGIIAFNTFYNKNLNFNQIKKYMQKAFLS
jgi:shikimate dehydrogenase